MEQVYKQIEEKEEKEAWMKIKLLYIDFVEITDVQNLAILVWKDLWGYCSPVVVFWYCCRSLFIKEFCVFTVM